MIYKIANSSDKTNAAETINSNVLKGIVLNSCIKSEKMINTIKFKINLFVLNASKIIFLMRIIAEKTYTEYNIVNPQRIFLDTGEWNIKPMFHKTNTKIL
ncbi:hypothetical protein [Flavobacterium sp.]|uniref:hypothetical protein n=1 Tax=Flavobacterium sp. TaxID=239 RepID=UPI003262F631